MLRAGQEIILYGSGRRCSRILPLLINARISVKAVVDSKRAKWGTRIDHFEVQAPSILRKCKDNVLCITVANQAEQERIREILQHEYEYDLAFEIRYDDLALEAVLLKYKAKIGRTDYAKDSTHRIVFDCGTGFGLGGIEAWTKGLCMELSERGFDNLHIFTDTGEYMIPDPLLPIVDQVLDRERLRFREDILDCIMEYLTNSLPVTVITGKPEIFLEAAALLKQIAPDQLRIISVIHGGEKHLYKLYDRYREQIDYYVAVSEDIEGDLAARGIPEGRIASITCPVACEEKLERAYATGAEQPVRIGYAGRIVVLQKRMDLMLKVMEALEKKGVPYIFELAGDGPYKAEMEEQVMNPGWDNHVRFVGLLERKHISEFWRQQDIYVNIADAEGRSISQLEAMANGAVPVATCTSGTREDICDGENGYLVEIGDYEGIADRIKYLAEHRELLPVMGQKSHDAVYPKCRKEVHTKFWEDLLSK